MIRFPVSRLKKRGDADDFLYQRHLLLLYLVRDHHPWCRDACCLAQARAFLARGPFVFGLFS